MVCAQKMISNYILEIWNFRLSHLEHGESQKKVLHFPPDYQQGGGGRAALAEPAPRRKQQNPGRH
ncbi:hypothetical protein JY97_01700 [Alkalispirochaeta odontotermitis]|nr:hypothetical protein JY97_01700 [Alkalispirochaeta odontotermitis]CAB1081985.1 hypothetical protein D1AOALGA4SA_9625 [Olavius algarvensis Delta 1 endosymbiont]